MNDRDKPADSASEAEDDTDLAGYDKADADSFPASDPPAATEPGA